MSKKFTRWLASRIALFRAVDVILVPSVAAAAPVLALFRWIGAKRLPVSRRVLKAIGVFPIRNHYYEPRFVYNDLKNPLDEERNLPGIDLDLAAQVALLASLSSRNELTELDLRNRGNPTGFVFGNGAYESGDAEIWYSMLRTLKPRRVLEVGSGHSSLLAHAALERNRVETGADICHTLIEPFENPWLESLGNASVVRERAEDVSLDVFRELASGDVLFIDSSHMIRPQGDVLRLYLEVLPQLQAGVIVHIHDIFTPRDYLATWLTESVHFWNEQYLLEALLSNSSRYEILLALNFLKHNAYPHLSEMCPYMTPEREPGSLYLRIRG